MITCKNCRNYSPKNNVCRISGGGVQEETRICKDFMVIPAERKLDGVYFRVKRNGKWGNVCFSDMTAEEREEVIGNRTAEWWKALAGMMADDLRAIGDRFDIKRAYPEEDE